ncbi:MAG: 5'-methylthioadenosine/adenosylhomocysteine nucleosidase [Fusobacteria bacterium]|nr:5'-methylthioadenosine/adenosylhomocysteine nucleosidase [Fusobacteriota bacterium]
MIKLIGIIGAMQEEIIELKKQIKNIKENTMAGFVFYSGILNKKDIILVQSGIGKVNSAICTTILIEQFNVTKIIFTGVAGGVNNDLNVGDIVISKDLIQHDVDATAFGAKYGQIPRMNQLEFKSDINLIELAKKSAKDIFTNEKIVVGRILSGDQFVSSIEKIKWLRDKFNGDCVEMEGASVAHVATLFNIPFVVIRSISDKADHSANIDFNKFVNIAANNSKNIVLKMLEIMV